MGEPRVFINFIIFLLYYFYTINKTVNTVYMGLKPRRYGVTVSASDYGSEGPEFESD